MPAPSPSPSGQRETGLAAALAMRAADMRYGNPPGDIRPPVGDRRRGEPAARRRAQGGAERGARASIRELAALAVG